MTYLANNLFGIPSLYDFGCYHLLEEEKRIQKS